MKSAAAIAFDYRPSRWLMVAIAAVAVIALAALAVSGLDAYLKIAVGAVAVAYTTLELRKFLLASLRRAAWHEAGHWRVVDARGEEHVAELAGSVARGNWIVLRLRRRNHVLHALILAPDNSSADLRRRLRVRLANTQV